MSFLTGTLSGALMAGGVPAYSSQLLFKLNTLLSGLLCILEPDSVAVNARLSGWSPCLRATTNYRLNASRTQKQCSESVILLALISYEGLAHLRLSQHAHSIENTAGSVDVDRPGTFTRIGTCPAESYEDTFEGAVE